MPVQYTETKQRAPSRCERSGYSAPQQVAAIPVGGAET